MIHIEPATTIRTIIIANTALTRFQRAFESVLKCKKNTNCTKSCPTASTATATHRATGDKSLKPTKAKAIVVITTDNTKPCI